VCLLYGTNDIVGTDLYLFLMGNILIVWRQGLIGRPEPYRERKLLAHRSELKRLFEFAKGTDACLVMF